MNIMNIWIHNIEYFSKSQTYSSTHLKQIWQKVDQVDFSIYSIHYRYSDAKGIISRRQI